MTVQRPQKQWRKIIAIVGILYRKYAYYTLYRSRLPIYGIAIVRSLSFLFLDDFEGDANISVAIKSCFTVSKTCFSSISFIHLVHISGIRLFPYEIKFDLQTNDDNVNAWAVSHTIVHNCYSLESEVA